MLQSLETIFLRYRGPLRSLSYTILQNSEDSEEVVQEVFTEILQVDVTMPEEQLRNYLFRSVKNRSLNRIRRTQRLHRFLEKLGEWFFPPWANEVAREEREDWTYYVRKLPPKYREVLILRVKEELTLAQVAEILDLPLGTVKGRINKAIQLMRKMKEAK